MKAKYCSIACSPVSVPHPTPIGGEANPAWIGIWRLNTKLYLSRKLTKISCSKQLGVAMSRCKPETVEVEPLEFWRATFEAPQLVVDPIPLGLGVDPQTRRGTGGNDETLAI